ncbi:hypothetical protein NLI96_g13294 [Meripilus lineatus]|uniref:Fumarate lyase N-terminal domain-containing protein n=1 Tax=Meripilus lineatus TaxID=2056292 RepID=A0AAD5UQ74_9APHY|nr:hypothetical protein NLI96_g13294 [Physisporinus lineatus]
MCQSKPFMGVHNPLRALENFPISGIPIGQYGGLVRALAEVKLAAVQTNAELGLIDPERTQAISKACEEIIAGKHHEHFVVDVIQGGAGTSSNMNVNEVVANRALEILGSARGDYQTLHPNEHVNIGQSTNDGLPVGHQAGPAVLY